MNVKTKYNNKQKNKQKNKQNLEENKEILIKSTSQLVFIECLLVSALCRSIRIVYVPVREREEQKKMRVRGFETAKR